MLVVELARKVNKGARPESATTAVLRPPACPNCGAPAFRGKRLSLHGHGSRLRGVEGCVAPKGDPDCRYLMVRRFRCVACSRTCTVLPVELAPRCQYLVGAIFAVVALYGQGTSALKLRQQWSSAAHHGLSGGRDWPMVRRWIRWLSQRLDLQNGTYRERAEGIARRAAACASCAHDKAPLAERAWHGARRCLG